MKIWRGERLRFQTSFFDVLATTRKTQFATMALKPGQTSGPFGSDHAQADQWLVVLEGEGEAIGESGAEKISEGDVVLIAAPEKHQFKCVGEAMLKTITFYGPPAYPNGAS